jgi:hypothetical protein
MAGQTRSTEAMVSLPGWAGTTPGDGYGYGCGDRIPDRIGEFDVLAQLGGGPMGAVYRARDRRRGQVLALKALWPGSSVDEDGVPLLLDRIQAAHRRFDLGIVPVLAFGEVDGLFYWVMPLLEAGSLKDLLRLRTLEPEEAAMLGSQVAGALARAHLAGLVHGDVKASNLLFDEAGTALLADFGMAALVRPGLGAPTPSTASGVPPYRAPELSRGARPSPASDLCGLAAVLYECLIGRPPDSPASSPERPGAAARRGLPPALRAPILRALQEDPRDRFPSAAAFADALAHASACRPVRLPARGSWEDWEASDPPGWASPLIGRPLRVQTQPSAGEPGRLLGRLARVLGLVSEPAPTAGEGRRGGAGGRLVAAALCLLVAAGVLAWRLGLSPSALLTPAAWSSGVAVRPPPPPAARETAAPTGAPTTAPAPAPPTSSPRPLTSAAPPPAAPAPQISRGPIGIPATGELLPNGDFERRLSGWRPSSSTPGVAMVLACGPQPGAEHGACYAEVRADAGGRSVTTDTGAAVAPGRYLAACWFRSADGQPYPGRLALTGEQDGQGGFVGFQARRQWARVPLTATLTSAERGLALLVYLDAAGRALDVDDCSLRRQGP